MLRLLQSAGITLAVSVVIGGIFYAFKSIFWLPMCIATVAQVSLWLIISYISDIYIKVKTEQIATELSLIHI